ncbi:peptidase M23 [Mailhella sp.]|uniref:peptidase M23 n=1 Tax=Mailhella sp. TaxID=1981029 RepID=UPI003AB712E6
MTTTTFDALAYFEKLKEAGVPEAQAKVQAAAFREFTAIQDERAKQELATKADLRETELRLQAEIEKVRADIEKVKYDLLKWQIGGWLALAAIMAKGFGWLGF